MVARSWNNFPSPLVGEGGCAKRSRMRGIFTIVQSASPSSALRAPSPIKGEGKKKPIWQGK